MIPIPAPGRAPDPADKPFSDLHPASRSPCNQAWYSVPEMMAKRVRESRPPAPRPGRNHPPARVSRASPRPGEYRAGNPGWIAGDWPMWKWLGGYPGARIPVPVPPGTRRSPHIRPDHIRPDPFRGDHIRPDRGRVESPVQAPKRAPPWARSRQAPRANGRDPARWRKPPLPPRIPIPFLRERIRSVGAPPGNGIPSPPVSHRLLPPGPGPPSQAIPSRRGASASASPCSPE